MPSRRTLVAAVVVGALLIAPLSRAMAQAPLAPIHYIYDELNRLAAVIDRNNDAAAYVYDPVGNLLTIERINAADIPGPVGITLVAPSKGKAGTAVTIYGKGFGTTATRTSGTIRCGLPTRGACSTSSRARAEARWAALAPRPAVASISSRAGRDASPRA